MKRLYKRLKPKYQHSKIAIFVFGAATVRWQIEDLNSDDIDRITAASHSLKILLSKTHSLAKKTNLKETLVQFIENHLNIFYEKPYFWHKKSAQYGLVFRNCFEVLGKLSGEQELAFLRSTLEDLVAGNLALHELHSNLHYKKTGDVNLVISGPYLREFILLGCIEAAIGLTGDDDDIEPLKPLLQSNSDVVRQGAVDAISNIGSEKAIDTLVSLLKSESENVPVYAAKGLARDGGERALEALINALESPNGRCV